VPKVVYGTDDRIDLFEETDLRRRTWALSTCALMTRSQLTENLDETVTIRTSAYGVCEDEPFSTQPVSAFCSGFIVGDDLIATAGHCYDAGDLSNARFVFGFSMVNENTPNLVVPADNVYRGVSVVAQILTSTDDYAIVRVDRPIDVEGAVPFQIRREGVVPVGANVGVIGYPSGLPVKLAFGDTTVVRSNTAAGFFVANLDTYGGNSGSPVIDPVTGIVEGILVRGDTDFIQVGGCRRSNVQGDSAGRGEDVSKTTRFENHIPIAVTTNGQLLLDRNAYVCEDTAVVVLRDSDLMGMNTVEIPVSATNGDEETLVLRETDTPGEFAAEFSIAGGAVVVDDGVLQLAPGDMFNLYYLDMLHSPDEPDQVVASAVGDCSAASIGDVQVLVRGAAFATLYFTSNEPVAGNVRLGSECGSTSIVASYVQDTTHVVTVTGLTPSTRYQFHIYAVDEAGNEILEDNGGACFTLETASSFDYQTEIFSSGNPPDLSNRTLRFTPDADDGAYTVCRENITTLPVSDSGATELPLNDDGSSEVVLENGATLSYGGFVYDAVYVNANGNITFDVSDAGIGESIADHFDSPRVSAFFCDLNPDSDGRIWYRQLADRLVVTWENVPRFNQVTPNTIQVALMFNGQIQCSYLNLTSGVAFVGLSGGVGMMPDFSSKDLSASVSCSAQGDQFHSADVDENFKIDLQELLRVIQFYNLGGYHCDSTGEDGFAAGAGAQNCTPHDIDYDDQDWHVSLSETLRAVQFFNAIGYTIDPETEDGFSPLITE